MVIDIVLPFESHYTITMQLLHSFRNTSVISNCNDNCRNVVAMVIRRLSGDL